MTAARNNLESFRDRVRALVLIGAYDYGENENAGPSLRGFDPGLAASLEVASNVQIDVHACSGSC